MKRIWKTFTIVALTGVVVLGFRKMAVAAPVLETSSTEMSEQDQAAKSVSGRVVSGNDESLSGAVVYLKNTKTLAVKSFISGQDGSFRFNNLSMNVDYELYAEHNGQRSDTRTISSFDSRRQVNVNLRIK